MMSNLFQGPTHFFEIKNKGLINPEFTLIRVDQSPLPDRVYFVNKNYLLQSCGRGEYNMSAIGAEKGIYDPLKELKNERWSISGLNLWK